MNLKTNFITSRRNNPALRNPDKYKIQKYNALILHWTASTGKNAKAENVLNYWNNTNRYGSAHFIIDEDRIINSLPLNQVGYHVGASAHRYTDLALEIMEDYGSPNFTTLGLEMCLYENNNHDLTIDTAAKLCAQLLILINQYHNEIWTNNIHRHFDLTKKLCPKLKNGDRYELMTEEQLALFRHKVELEFWSLDKLIL